MNRARLLILFILFSLFLTLWPPGRIAGQGPGPPLPRSEPPSPMDAQESRGLWERPPDGLWYTHEDVHPPLEAMSSLGTGGPDDFGYTWDDSVPLNWIDVRSGNDVGLGGDTQVVGPIALPFSFSFYENTYDQIYISKYGYVGFHPELTIRQGRVANPAPPNNIIAPYWVPCLVNEPNSTGKVYYTTGGAPPNRHFVMEWYQVQDAYKPLQSTYTFEVVLYENGDVLFQYATMTYKSGWYCAHAGIEDSDGLDGLAYGLYCHSYASNKAVRFYRPGPSARVQARPAYQSRFSAAGESAVFQQCIGNTGDLGSDTYDLVTVSPWPVELYATDGLTPLTDTDGDGTVDTGLVAPGSTVTITVKVNTPAGSAIGTANSAAVTIRSSLNTAKRKTVSFQTAVPAPFAQVFRDDANGAMSLYLAHPKGQVLRKASADEQWGYDVAVAEAPNGNFIYAWTRGWELASGVYVREIEYTLLDCYGQTLHPITKLTDHSDATLETADYNLALAVAPDGRIGVLWCQYVFDSDTSRFNYNVCFAVLDASGNVWTAPRNLTNNTTWGARSDINMPGFYDSTIAATGDNRFVLAWAREHWTGSAWVTDIYYTILNTDATQVRSTTRFTSDLGQSDGHWDPNLAALSGNRVLLSWTRASPYSDIHYAVPVSYTHLTLPTNREV